MRSRRASRVVPPGHWPWRVATATAAVVAVVIAAASAGGCATDPPPRPAQIDPSNPGAPESTPLEVGGGAPPVKPPESTPVEVGGGAPPVMPHQSSSSAPTGGEGADAGAHESPQHRPVHQHGAHDEATPPRQPPAHQHEHGGGGAP